MCGGIPSNRENREIVGIVIRVPKTGLPYYLCEGQTSYQFRRRYQKLGFLRLVNDGGAIFGIND